MSQNILNGIKSLSLFVALTVAVAPAVAKETTSSSSSSSSSMAQVLNEGVEFGDWNNTQILCDRILRKDPGNADALVAGARLKALLGKSDAAIADCSTVLRSSPNTALALLTRGFTSCDIGKVQAGQQDLKSYLALTQSAHDLPTRYRRAMALESLKDHKTAQKQFENIVIDTAAATTAEDLYHRALAQVALGKFKEAPITLSKIRPLSPYAPRLISLLAYCHTESGNLDLALKECAEGARLAPGYYCNQGVWGSALEKSKKYDEAIRHYDHALEIEDRYPFALRHRATCYGLLGDFAAAAKDFTKAKALDPNGDPSTLLSRATAYNGASQYDEAVADCKKLIALDCKNFEAWRQLGYAQIGLKKWKEACAASTQALKLSPNDSDALCDRARSEIELGRNDLAFADYATAIHSNPKLGNVYFSRGLLFRDEKQYAKSIADLSQAIKINPKDACYFCARGCAEVRNGNYKEAIADCNQSLKINANRTHPYLSRGEAYAALGQFDLALQDLNKVAADWPSEPEVFAERGKVYSKLNQGKLAELDLVWASKLQYPAKK